MKKIFMIISAAAVAVCSLFILRPISNYNLKWLPNGSDGGCRRVGVHTENEAESFSPHCGDIANDYIICNGFQ